VCLQLVNWIGGDILDGEGAALAFTCKGTDAATLKECATATDAGKRSCWLHGGVVQLVPSND
jgi:hypothetical protein